MTANLRAMATLTAAYVLRNFNRCLSLRGVPHGSDQQPPRQMALNNREFRLCTKRREAAGMAVNHACRSLGLSSFTAEKSAHFLLDLPAAPAQNNGNLRRRFQMGTTSSRSSLVRS